MICEKTFNDQWISVKEMLPQEDQLVLIYLRGHIRIRLFQHSSFHDMENDYYTPLDMEDGVTYWMALPEPPK